MQKAYRVQTDQGRDPAWGRRTLGGAVRARLLLVGVSVLTVGAFAGSAFGQGETNSGSIKLFDGDKELPANDPKACTFEVAGLNFDANEQGIVITVEGQGGNAGPGSHSETVDSDADGNFLSSQISLPDGSYSVTADDGEQPRSQDKVKVLQVECSHNSHTGTNSDPVSADPPATNTSATNSPASPVLSEPRFTG